MSRCLSEFVPRPLEIHVTDLQTVPAIPVSTTNDVPGRTLASYVGPAFGLIIRSTGAGGNLMGTVCCAPGRLASQW